MTTHSPFVPSDMPKENVLIFKKDVDNNKIQVLSPNIETYGSTFDDILEECFKVKPPISGLSRKEIDSLKKSNDSEEIRNAMNRLGYSVDKVLLVDRLRELSKKE